MKTKTEMKSAKETFLSSESCFFKTKGTSNSPNNMTPNALVYIIIGGLGAILCMADFSTSPKTLKKIMFNPKELAIIIKLIQNMELLPSNRKPISDMPPGSPGQSILALINSTLLNMTYTEATNENSILK